jgi:hypothetical protein
MSLVELSLQRIALSLPKFPGATVPEQLSSGRTAAETAIRKYMPDFRFDQDGASSVLRTIDAWAERNQEALSGAMQQAPNELPEQLTVAVGSAEQVRSFLIASFTVAASGMGPWMGGEVARVVEAGGRTAGWATLDAEHRLQTFAIIVKLENDGELGPIMKGSSGMGALGIPPALIVGIVIATVVFAAVVITTIYLNKQLELNNRLMRDLCEKAQKDGNDVVVEECINATKDLQLGFLEKTAGKLAGWLVIGAVAVIGGKYVIDQLMEKRSTRATEHP